MVSVPHKWTTDELDKLVGRVLAVLPEPTDQPMSTPRVRTHFPDLDAYERENHVRRALDKLHIGGWAAKTTVPDDTRVFWRLTRAGSEGRKRGHNLPPAH